MKKFLSLLLVFVLVLGLLPAQALAADNDGAKPQTGETETVDSVGAAAPQEPGESAKTQTAEEKLVIPAVDSIAADRENDIWLNSDFERLTVGGSYTIYARRLPELVSNTTSNEGLTLPPMHYDVIFGSDVVQVDQAGKISALKEGTAVIRVSYDAVKPDWSSETFGAISPVNYAYMTVEVNNAPADVEIVTDLNKISVTKNENGEAVYTTKGTTYDTVYFTNGSSVPYTFQASAQGAELTVTCNGEVLTGKDGSYTANLKSCTNVIQILAAKDGKTKMQAYSIDARKIEIVIKNLSRNASDFMAGDQIAISFKGITMPISKLATIYNPCFSSSWGGKSTGVQYTVNGEQVYGRCGQWDLATRNTIKYTLPQAGKVTFSDGCIDAHWWGSPLDAHKKSTGAGDPNLNADTNHGTMSTLPGFTITVIEGTADQKAAKAVDDQISAIGEVTLKSEEAIAAARGAYEALTAEQQALVTKLDTLKKAEADMVLVKADKAEAQKVDDMISALGELNAETRDKVTAIRKAFDALTQSQQKMVEQKDTLEQVEWKLQQVDDLDKKISKLGEITLESEKAILNIRRNYERMSDAQKALVTGLADLEKAENQLNVLKAAAVDAQIDAIGEVTQDKKTAIRDARTAYNGLTAEQQKLVTGLSVLEDAEKALNALNAEKVSVTVSLEKANAYPVLPQTITVSADLSDKYGYADSVQDGVSLLDCLIAVHEVKLGDAFTAETCSTYLKLDQDNDPALVLGGDGYELRFVVDGLKPNDGVAVEQEYGGHEFTALKLHEARVLNGDVVQFYFNQDSNGLDNYAVFTREGKPVTELTVPANKDVALSVLTYCPEWNGLQPNIRWDVPDMDLPVCLLVTEGEKAGTMVPIDGVVAPEYDGSFTVRFPEPGTYYLTLDSNEEFAAWGMEYYVVPRICKVTVGDPETVDVTVSLEKDNVYPVLPQKIPVATNLAERYGYVDAVTDGVSALDALVAVHEILFAQDFTAETKDGYLAVTDSGFVTTIMGEETTNNGFAVNGLMPNDGVLNEVYGTYTGYSVNQAQIVKDDVVQFFFYNPDGYWGEIYTNFLKGDNHVTQLQMYTGVAQTLNVKGYSYVYEGCNPKLKWKDVTDIQVCLLNMDGENAGTLTPIEGAVTDENGRIALKFDKAGTYRLAVTSDPDNFTFILPQICTVTVSDPVTADVTVSLEQDNFYPVLPQKVTVSEALSDQYGYTDTVVGNVSALDALVAVHEILFADAFTPETRDDFLVVTDSGFVTTIMGEVTTNNGFAVNGMMPNDGVLNEAYGTYTGYSVNQAQVVTDDVVQFFFYNPDGYWGEIYTNFLKGDTHITELKLCAGVAQTLNVKGYSFVYEGCNPEIKWKDVADIQICLVNMDGENAGTMTPIEGAVTDEDGSFTLKLQKAGTYYLAVTSDPDNFTYILPQICKVTVTDHDFTWTVTKEATEDAPGELTGVCAHCGLTETREIPALGGETGEIIVESRKENACDGQLVSTDVLQKINLTSQELEAMAAGTDLKIVLSVSDIGNTVSEADKAAIAAVLGDNKLGMYLDISLLKQLDEDNVTAVHNTNGEIEISIHVPDTLRKSGRTFRIIRLHEGTAQLLDSSYSRSSHTLTFGSDRFSTYALVYEDAQIIMPETGDQSHVILFTVTLAGSLTALSLLLYFSLKKRKTSGR